MNCAGKEASDLRGYLEALQAHRVPHSARSLLEHLVGTHDILHSWNCAVPVCRAGMFHSIYGTNAFGFQRLDMQDRDLVIRMVGEEAEHLIYLFCVSDRLDAFFEAIDVRMLRHRYTGAMLPVDEATARRLVAIECANLIEQNIGERFLRRFIDRFGEASSAEFSETMLSDVDQYIN